MQKLAVRGTASFRLLIQSGKRRKRSLFFLFAEWKIHPHTISYMADNLFNWHVLNTIDWPQWNLWKAPFWKITPYSHTCLMPTSNLSILNGYSQRTANWKLIKSKASRPPRQQNQCYSFLPYEQTDSQEKGSKRTSRFWSLTRAQTAIWTISSSSEIHQLHYESCKRN